MNKQSKKKLELQLSTAIEDVLGKQDSKAAVKSRKSIRQASKAVVKKFNKALKSIEGKKDSAKKKELKSKKKDRAKGSPIKNISGETARIKRSYEKTPVVPPVETPQRLPTDNPRTENL